MVVSFAVIDSIAASALKFKATLEGKKVGISSLQPTITLFKGAQGNLLKLIIFTK